MKKRIRTEEQREARRARRKRLVKIARTMAKHSPDLRGDHVGDSVFKTYRRIHGRGMPTETRLKWNTLNHQERGKLVRGWRLRPEKEPAESAT